MRKNEYLIPEKSSKIKSDIEEDKINFFSNFRYEEISEINKEKVNNILKEDRKNLNWKLVLFKYFNIHIKVLGEVERSSNKNKKNKKNSFEIILTENIEKYFIKDDDKNEIAEYKSFESDCSSLNKSYKFKADNELNETFYNTKSPLLVKTKYIPEQNNSNKIAEFNKFSKMAHEFKTPLNVIITLIEELEDDCNYASSNDDFSLSILQSSKKKKDTQKSFDIIKNLSNYLMFLITDITQYLTLTSNQNLKIIKEKISIKPILSFCINICRSLLNCGSKNDKVECSLEIDENLNIDNIIVESNEMRLKQVIINLLSNSVKFTKIGKIQLRVKYDEIKKAIIITVSDTGIGIKDEDKYKIFNDFNIDNQFENNNHGSGLGLSICKDIINKLDHSIKFDSKYGQGSEFKIIIELRHINRNTLESIETMNSNRSGANRNSLNEMIKETLKYSKNDDTFSQSILLKAESNNRITETKSMLEEYKNPIRDTKTIIELFKSNAIKETISFRDLKCKILVSSSSREISSDPLRRELSLRGEYISSSNDSRNQSRSKNLNNYNNNNKNKDSELNNSNFSDKYSLKMDRFSLDMSNNQNSSQNINQMINESNSNNSRIRDNSNRNNDRNSKDSRNRDSSRQINNQINNNFSDKLLRKGSDSKLIFFILI